MKNAGMKERTNKSERRRGKGLEKGMGRKERGKNQGVGGNRVGEGRGGTCSRG